MAKSKQSKIRGGPVRSDDSPTFDKVTLEGADGAEVSLSVSGNGALAISSNSEFLDIGADDTGISIFETTSEVGFRFNRDALFESDLAVSGVVNFSQAIQIDLAPGSVAGAALADQAVVTAKIADQALTTAKIADQALTTAKIALDAVSENRLDAATRGKINGAFSASGGTIGGSVTIDGQLTATSNLIFSGAAQDEMPEIDCSAKGLKIDNGAVNMVVTGNMKLNGETANAGAGGIPTLTCSAYGLKIANGGTNVEVSGNLKLSGDTADAGAAGIPVLSCSSNGLRIDNGGRELQLTGDMRVSADTRIVANGTFTMDAGDYPFVLRVKPTLSAGNITQGGLVLLNPGHSESVADGVALYQNNAGFLATDSRQFAMSHTDDSGVQSQQAVLKDDVQQLQIDPGKAWNAVLVFPKFEAKSDVVVNGKTNFRNELTIDKNGENNNRINLTDRVDLIGDLYANPVASSESKGRIWVYSNEEEEWLFIGHLDTEDQVKTAYFYRPSDESLKKNIAPMESSLTKLTTLRPVTYEWNEAAYEKFSAGIEHRYRSDAGTPESDAALWAEKRQNIRKERSGVHRGFIAQEMADVFPEWVNTGKDGYKQIDTSDMFAVLVKSIQELKAGTDAEIAALKSEISALRRDRVAEQAAC